MPVGRFHRAGLLPLILITGSSIVGCEAAPKPLTATMPPPNFNPPVVAARPAPAPTGPMTAPRPAGGAVVSASPYPGIAGPREWIPHAKPRKWLWIIVHHTAMPSGSMAKIDTAHRGQGWENGCGYNFVIGNGTDTRDGQIEVGPRWVKQITGAHTHTKDNRFNEQGIGIVMVGNFDETKPSKKQLESCARLVAYLMKTYKIPADRVLGHRNAKPTDCPGRFTNVAEIRRLATQMLADAGEQIPTAPKLALGPGGEMLQDAH